MSVCAKCGEAKKAPQKLFSRGGVPLRESGKRCGARCPEESLFRHRCRLPLSEGSVFCEFHRHAHDESHTEYKRICVGLLADVERANSDENFDSRSAYDSFLKRAVPQFQLGIRERKKHSEVFYPLDSELSESEKEEYADCTHHPDHNLIITNYQIALGKLSEAYDKWRAIELEEEGKKRAEEKKRKEQLEKELAELEAASTLSEEEKAKLAQEKQHHEAEQRAQQKRAKAKAKKKRQAAHRKEEREKKEKKDSHDRIKEMKVMTFVAAAMTKYPKPTEEQIRRAIEEIIVVPEGNKDLYCVAINIGTGEKDDIVTVEFDEDEKAAYDKLIMNHWMACAYKCTEVLKVEDFTYAPKFRDSGDRVPETREAEERNEKKKKKKIEASRDCGEVLPDMSGIDPEEKERVIEEAGGEQNLIENMLRNNHHTGAPEKQDSDFLRHVFYIAVEKVLLDLLAKVNPDIRRIPTFLVTEIRQIKRHVARDAFTRARYNAFVRKLPETLAPIAKKFASYFDLGKIQIAGLEEDEKKGVPKVTTETPVIFVRFLVDAFIMKISDDAKEACLALAHPGARKELLSGIISKALGKTDVD